MINYLKGTVAEIGENLLVLEVNGVGYELIVSAGTLRRIKKEGESVAIFTFMSLREDGVTLFGFCDRAEKNIFLQLITISGIGPKMAIAVLSGISAEELAAAIATGDALRLSGIKGIGKKTAERIVLELKDKIGGEYGADFATAVPKNQDAVLALVSMGFSRQEAVSAIAKVKGADEMSAEEIIINALKNK